MVGSEVEELVKKLLEEHGIEEGLKISEAVVNKLKEIRKDIKPIIRYGPNPKNIKILVYTMSGNKILNLDDAWGILNTKLGIKDKKKNYTLSILDWNGALFQRVTKTRGDRRWKLTPYGEELAEHLTDSVELTSVEKTLISGLYLNEPITLALYNFYKDQNRTRKEGIKFLQGQAKQLRITPEQAEWYMGEKTSALVSLGLLTRIRGKETVLT